MLIKLPAEKKVSQIPAALQAAVYRREGNL
jgi:hypothetical protein